MANSDMAWATAGLLLVYMGVILYFVVQGARRTASLADYAVGSGFPPWVVGLSLAASITSAATFVINPGFIALYGLSAFLAFAVVLPTGLILSLIFLTKGFRRYGMGVKAVTLSQWIGVRYGSSKFALFFAVLSLLLLTFIVLICVGMTKVIAPALGVAETPVLLGIVVFVFGYMMFGGANTMVYTNTIQAIIMIVVAIMLLASGHEHFGEGLGGFWQKLATIDPNLVQMTNPNSPVSRDFFEIFFCNFIVGIAIVCQPHIITRSLFLRNDQDVNKYLWVGILTEVLFFLVVFAGFYARLEFPDLTFDGQPLRMDGIIPRYVVQEFPVWAALIVILGLLSAGLSTLEGLIQSLSTTLTSDLIRPLFGGMLGEQPATYVRLNKLVIVGLAVMAFFVSQHQLSHPNLSVGIFAQNGVYAYFSAAFVPVLFGLFFKNTPLRAVVAASVTAIVVHFGCYYGGITPYLQGAVRNPAVAACLALVASIVVGGLLNRNTSSD